MYQITTLYTLNLHILGVNNISNKAGEKNFQIKALQFLFPLPFFSESFLEIKHDIDIDKNFQLTLLIYSQKYLIIVEIREMMQH